MASQAPAYGALLVGGVALVAAIKGASFKDVLAGKNSPIRPLTTSIPSDFATASAGTSSNTASTVAFTPPSVSRGAKGAVEWASKAIGTNEGSKRESGWAAAVGISPMTAWCSAFVAAVLRSSGVTNAPADAAYSGSWLNWSGGTNLHTTNLSKAQPGDLLIFDWGDGGITDHVALYKGRGKMISGNDSNNSVGESSVPTGNIVGIVRPHYPSTRTSSGRRQPQTAVI